MYHGHQISLSALKRRLKAHGLHRRPLITWRATVEEVKNVAQKELDDSGENLGYRRIYASLKNSCKEGRR